VQSGTINENITARGRDGRSHPVATGCSVGLEDAEGGEDRKELELED
jgi:hypothetical protein